MKIDRIQDGFHPSDLEMLNGTGRLLDELARSPCIDLRMAGEAFTLLASGVDVPERLRQHYEKVGRKLTGMELHLKKYLRTMQDKEARMARQIASKLPSYVLSETEMVRLHQVNARLQCLEKILKERLIELHERLNRLEPVGVEWDRWDCTEIKLWLRFNPEENRPAYNRSDDGLLEPVVIKVGLSRFDNHTDPQRKYWGLDDGENHSDLIGCEGSQMQHFQQCYLFHELWDHAEVGMWGMLNLHSIWIEIMPHQSGDFVI